MRATRAIAALGLALGGLVGLGCLAATPAAPVAPVASVAGFGYSAWVGSRLRFVEDSGFDTVSLATERALVGLELGVRLTTEIRAKGLVRTRVYEITSERGDLAILRLRRLSPVMTDVTIDVGIMGNRPAGELIAEHIRWYTDGDTIRAARRAAMEALDHPSKPEAAGRGKAGMGEPGHDFALGLF